MSVWLNNRCASSGDMVRQLEGPFFQKKAVVGWKLANFFLSTEVRRIGVKVLHSKKTTFAIASELQVRNNVEVVVRFAGEQLPS